MKTLTVAIPDDVYERAERRAAALGMSLPGEVGDLVKRFSEGNDIQEAAEGLAFPNRTNTLCQELAAIAAECSSPNWDGQGAAPVSPDTLRHAQRFASNIPNGLTAPSAGVEADGHLTLEWYRDLHWTLSVSISPDSTLYYAALFGTSDVRGREEFQGEVPPIILSLIRRTHSA